MYKLRHTEIQNWEEHTAVFFLHQQKMLSCCKHQMLVVTVYNIKMPLGFLPSEFKIMSVKLLIRSYNYWAKEKSNCGLHIWNLSSTSMLCINRDSPCHLVHVLKGCVHHLSPSTDNKDPSEGARLPSLQVLQPVPAGTSLHAVWLVQPAVPQVFWMPQQQHLDPGHLPS